MEENKRFFKIIETLKNRGMLANYVELACILGTNKAGVSDMKAGRKKISIESLKSMILSYPCINIDWILTGKGEMLRADISSTNESVNKKLIPFYDDVVTVGGMNSISATVDGCMPTSEFIDAGDWFRDATAAVRHYGESMQEYPSGCILALRKINNRGMIVWGKNYCIETSDFRITKRLQRGDERDAYVMAYSTNKDTYPDGRLIHEPVKIPTDEINNLFLVLGCVVKEQSSGAVYIK